MSAVREVLMPTSEAEAVELFGDGVHVTVIARRHDRRAEHRRRPARAAAARCSWARAGLAGISRNGATVTIGATTSVAALVDLAAPLGPCAANVADPEVRAQATLGGNLCASGTSEVPRGDLQGALLALDAQVRSRRRRRRAQRVARALPRRARRPPPARPSPTTSPPPAPSSTSATRTRTPTRCSRSPPYAPQDGPVRLAATGSPAAHPPARRRARRGRPRGRGCGRGRRGRARRRRARLRLVPREDAAGARAPCAHELKESA